jgi:hypothetical protein
MVSNASPSAGVGVLYPGVESAVDASDTGMDMVDSERTRVPQRRSMR